jgi:hypothetical protein
MLCSFAGLLVGGTTANLCLDHEVSRSSRVGKRACDPGLLSELQIAMADRHKSKSSEIRVYLILNGGTPGNI